MTLQHPRCCRRRGPESSSASHSSPPPASCPENDNRINNICVADLGRKLSPCIQLYQWATPRTQRGIVDQGNGPASSRFGGNFRGRPTDRLKRLRNGSENSRRDRPMPDIMHHWSRAFEGLSMLRFSKFGMWTASIWQSEALNTRWWILWIRCNPKRHFHRFTSVPIGT